jgi:hypothetical protein
MRKQGRPRPPNWQQGQHSEGIHENADGPIPARHANLLEAAETEGPTVVPERAPKHGMVNQLLTAMFSAGSVVWRLALAPRRRVIEGYQRGGSAEK